jgi:hypothetical protein
MEHIETSVKALQAHSQARCVVVLGGDFNAVREEFVFGNQPVFFEQDGVRKIVPSRVEPVAGKFGAPLSFRLHIIFTLYSAYPTPFHVSHRVY